jgi:hypothetical protein
MRRVIPYAVAGALLGAAVLALVRGERETVPEAAPHRAEEPAETASPHSSPVSPVPTAAETPVPQRAPIAPIGVENAEAPSLTWTVPSTWQQVPNPNPMRIATYRIGTPGAADDVAELSVSRAGGSPEANVQRWVAQFEDATTPKQSERTPHGVKVTLVEVSGTYGAGPMAMPTAAGPAKRPGYTLLGAIAETPQGSPYFFKLLGPTATVAKAHASFDALVDSFTPR